MNHAILVPARDRTTTNHQPATYRAPRFEQCGSGISLQHSLLPPGTQVAPIAI